MLLKKLASYSQILKIKNFKIHFLGKWGRNSKIGSQHFLAIGIVYLNPKDLFDQSKTEGLDTIWNFREFLEFLQFEARKWI